MAIDTDILDRELARWIASPPPLRIDELAARLASEAVGLTAGYVRLRLATGVDGETDLRVEIESDKGEMHIARWRPDARAAGHLDDVWELGETRRPAKEARAKAMRETMLNAALADPTPLKLFVLAESHQALGERLRELRDISEAKVLANADATAEADETMTLAAQFDSVAARLADENAIRKAALEEERAAQLARDIALGIVAAQADAVDAVADEGIK